MSTTTRTRNQRKKTRITSCRKETIEAKETKRELEGKQRNKDRRYQLQMERMKISMEGKIAIVKIHFEKVRLKVEQKNATIKVKEKLTVKLPKTEL